MGRRQVRHFRANGRRFGLRTAKGLRQDGERLWGDIDYEKGQVRVDSTAKEETLMDTRIHEFTHGFFDAGNQRLLHEETVDRFATELTIFLRRLGYRCPDDDDYGED